MTPLIRRSFAAAASAALLTFALGGVIPSIAAQDAAPAKSARKAPDPTRRVPTYFGSLGLSTEQREEIYAIQAKYVPQIQELERKIEGLRERQMSDCEDVLTPAQKKILGEARKSAVDRRKAAAKARAAAAE